jgi:hypothetical protein
METHGSGQCKKIPLQDITSTIREQDTNEIKTYSKNHLHYKYLTKFVEIFQIGFVQGIKHDFYVHVIHVLGPPLV